MKHDQLVEGGDIAPLLRSGEISSGALHPSLQPLAQERHTLITLPLTAVEVGLQTKRLIFMSMFLFFQDYSKRIFLNSIM